jgi:hypothetical protein
LTASASTGTYTAGVQLSPFADDGYGNFLGDPSPASSELSPSLDKQTIFGHEPILRAAFNLTGAEFTLIANNLKFISSTQLTLNNISRIFRVGWLAHTLGLSVVEFLLLQQVTDLNPFAPLDPDSTAPVEPPVLRFIGLTQALSNAGLRPFQALYLLWNQDISGTSSPDLSAITGLALTLRTALAAVAAQFTLQTDPDGSIAKSLMALVYGSQATEFYFGLLNNTLITAIPYPSASYPLPQQSAPVQAVLDASGGRLSYDYLRKQLSSPGFWTPTPRPRSNRPSRRVRIFRPYCRRSPIWRGLTSRWSVPSLLPTPNSCLHTSPTRRRRPRYNRNARRCWPISSPL